jgi:hypothetical protein
MPSNLREVLQGQSWIKVALEYNGEHDVGGMDLPEYARAQRWQAYYLVVCVIRSSSRPRKAHVMMHVVVHILQTTADQHGAARATIEDDFCSHPRQDILGDRITFRDRDLGCASPQKEVFEVIVHGPDSLI